VLSLLQHYDFLQLFRDQKLKIYDSWNSSDGKRSIFTPDFKYMPFILHALLPGSSVYSTVNTKLMISMFLQN